MEEEVRRVFTNKIGGKIYPLSKKGDAYSDAVRAKQKGSGSPKRKLAMKISALKKGMVNPENIDKKVYELITNPLLSAAQLQGLINDINVGAISVSNKISLGKLMVEKHKALFGQKTEIAITKSVEDELSEFNERLKEYHKRVKTTKDFEERKK